MIPGVPRSILPKLLATSLALFALAATAPRAHAWDILLQWTAPGDDSTYGRATEYDLRYSHKPRFPDDFLLADQWLDVPAPADAGSPQEATITGLEPGKPWYFAMRAKDERGNWSLISNVVTILPAAGADGEAEWPLAFSEALPSPARSATQFALSLPTEGVARVEALDLAGRRVRTLTQGTLQAGVHNLRWDLRDQGGNRVAPGVYFVRATAGGQSFRRRVVVVQ